MLVLGPEINLTGDDGIATLAAVVGRLAIRAAGDAGFRAWAEPILGDGDGDLAARIWNVARRVKYRLDPPGIEYVRDPLDTIRNISTGSAIGDCEDIAALVAALGIAGGMRARLVAYGKRGTWRHLAAELAAPGGPWIAIDPVVGNRIGLTPGAEWTKQVYSLQRLAVQGRGIAGIFEDLAKAVTSITGSATSAITSATPVMAAYSQFRTARSGPQAAPVGVTAPTPVALRATVPVMRAAPGPLKISFTRTADDAPRGGIDTNVLLIGGLALAALFLFKK